MDRAGGGRGLPRRLAADRSRVKVANPYQDRTCVNWPGSYDPAVSAPHGASQTFGLRRLAALSLLGGLFLVLLAVTRSARLERADLVLNNGTEVSTLDPLSVSGVPEGRVMYALYEGLTVRHPKTLAPVPGMAKSWELSNDGLTYTFHLRTDARWSNGDPLTAHDFEWSWQRLLHPETAAEYAYQLWYVRGAKQYSLMAEDRLYATNQIHPMWAKEMENGRVRLGLHGVGLHRYDAQVGVRVDAEVGQEFGDHSYFAWIKQGDDEGHIHAHVEGRVTAVNDALPRTVGELLMDPYEANWFVEVEPAENALANAQNTGELQSAAAFRTEVAWPAVGARATDDHTFIVTLASPTPFFIDLTSFYPTMPTHRPTWEWARENFPDTWQIEWIAPENIVTNGPFLLKERRINDRIRLVKNPDYWDADNVAMRTYDILAVEHYGTMLNLYLTGEVDWIERCAPNLIPRMMPREDFNPEPYLGSYFYRVNINRKPFDDKRVRRALALAMDRRAICEKILKKGEEPLYALCPDGLPGYPRPEMRHTPYGPGYEGYDEAFAADCAEARELLAEAGFGPIDEGGTKFPTLEIHYNTSEVHRDLAEVAADTWKRMLGIDAKLLNQEWKVYLDTQNTIAYDVSRSAWIGDYPDPNTFVDLFVTGGENNRTGWGHPRYDELVAKAAIESDRVERLKQLAAAEAILCDELPILPIYSYATQNVVSARLGGFHENVMDDHFPKFFYWMDDEELAAKRAAQPTDWEITDPSGPREGLYSPKRQREREAQESETH